MRQFIAHKTSWLVNKFSFLFPTFYVLESKKFPLRESHTILIKFPSNSRKTHFKVFPYPPFQINPLGLISAADSSERVQLYIFSALVCVLWWGDE